MNASQLQCQDQQRRRLIRQQQRNGLDYLEVSDDQQQLCVHFLGPVPQNLTPAHVQIEGGQVIRDIQVIALELELQEDPTLDSCLQVTVSEPGDFSPYQLKVVALDAAGRPTDDPHPDFDPRYSSLTFSFKVDCPNELDCLTDPACSPETKGDETAATINYLAKDYASFRQLILDRLSLLLPNWREHHAPDLGITLVELLAYVGDHLSYYQDAVATEAYLATARQRISVRRHVRLVDYALHEGCNARTWVHLQLTGSETFELPLAQTALITAIPLGPPAGQILTPLALRELPPTAYEVFEPIAQTSRILYQSHNAIRIYTWGDRDCCLSAGATQATLIDGWRSPANPVPPPEPEPDCDDDDQPEPPPWAGLDRALHLQPGDIVIFEEVIGARTGHEADANLRRRHAVCLTKVTPTVDQLQTVQQVTPPPPTVPPVALLTPTAEPDAPVSAIPPTPPAANFPNAVPSSTSTAATEFDDLPVPLLEIEWSAIDALPMSFCLSAIGLAPDCAWLTDITLVRGNVLLVDHGRTRRSEDLGTVTAQPGQATCQAEGLPSPVTPEPDPFRPQLQAGPLTFRQLLPELTPQTCAATHQLQQDPRRALPQLIQVTSQSVPDSPSAGDDRLDPPQIWTPVADLLASTASDRHFVVEIDDQGHAQLRFGTGEQGQPPPVGHQFTADYRVGNGPAGNIGAETIAYVVLDQPISGIQLTPRNPLPAVGGTAPETLEEVRQFAPNAFRDTLQRAITAEDYATIVTRDFAEQVQQAIAVLRWNGSWYEVWVAIDARRTGTPSAALLAQIEGHLHRFRRMGHDLRVTAAQIVPLQIAITVCVQPHYLRGQVKAALLEKLSNRLLPDGSQGFFHPDRLTFGDRVSLSPLIALVQATEGVESVTVTQFHRRCEDDDGTALLQGFIALGPLEIARLDNDPNQPENGQLILQMGGGR